MFWRIAAARGSMNIVNREGESGHPCLVPLCSVKGCEVGPFVITVAYRSGQDGLWMGLFFLFCELGFL